jgi:hypothetical protein
MRHTTVKPTGESQSNRVLEDVDKDDVELDDVKIVLKGAEFGVVK